MAHNCWEVRHCGREPGGRHAAERGVCPAATFQAADGYLGGTNAGRACCFVTGTFCDDALQGTYRDKSKVCWDCEFYRQLRNEHGSAFSLPAFAVFISKRDEASYRELVRENRHDTP